MTRCPNYNFITKYLNISYVQDNLLLRCRLLYFVPVPSVKGGHPKSQVRQSRCSNYLVYFLHRWSQLERQVPLNTQKHCPFHCCRWFTLMLSWTLFVQRAAGLVRHAVAFLLIVDFTGKWIFCYVQNLERGPLLRKPGWLSWQQAAHWDMETSALSAQRPAVLRTHLGSAGKLQQTSRDITLSPLGLFLLPNPSRWLFKHFILPTFTNLTRFMCLNEHWELCLTKVISLLTTIAFSTQSSCRERIEIFL